eukprot:jgi/Bigna1/67036/fgenesh1_pg.2_\
MSMQDGTVGDIINTIPVISQLKSLAQAFVGDTKGARLTQKSFLDHGILVSQMKSAVQAISGDREGAKLTQEKFITQQMRFFQGTGRLLTGYHLSNRLRHEASLERNPNWMASIPDGVSLWSLTLPGTHHSTAYTFQGTELSLPMHRTQRFPIYEQLVGGVRFLHVQMVTDLKSQESMCCTGQRDTKGKPCAKSMLTVPLSTLLKDLRKFVESFTSEIVVLHVQSVIPLLPHLDCRSEPINYWKDQIIDFLGKRLCHDCNPGSSSSSLSSSMSISSKSEIEMTVGNLRGKVVLLMGAEKIWSSLPHTRSSLPVEVVDRLLLMTKDEEMKRLLPLTSKISNLLITKSEEKNDSRTSQTFSSSIIRNERASTIRESKYDPSLPSLPNSLASSSKSISSAKTPSPPAAAAAAGGGGGGVLSSSSSTYQHSINEAAPPAPKTTPPIGPPSSSFSPSRTLSTMQLDSFLKEDISVPLRQQQQRPQQRQGIGDEEGSDGDSLVIVENQLKDSNLEKPQQRKAAVGTAPPDGGSAGALHHQLSHVAAFSSTMADRVVIFHAHVSPSPYALKVVSVGGGLMADAEVTNQLLLQRVLFPSHEKKPRIRQKAQRDGSSETGAASKLITLSMLDCCQVVLVDFIHSDIISTIINYNHINAAPNAVRTCSRFPGGNLVRMRRASEWLSERLDNDNRVDEIDPTSTVQVSCNKPIEIALGVLREGSEVFTNRDYTYRHVPETLLGGTIIRLPHVLPFNTKISVTLSSLQSTVYVIVERFERNGGLPRALTARGWHKSGTSPIIPEQKYGRKPLLVLYKSFTPGVVMLPALVEETCMSLVVVTQFNQRNYTKRQQKVLECARHILDNRADTYQKIAALVERENELLGSLLRFTLIPRRKRRNDNNKNYNNNIKAEAGNKCSADCKVEKQQHHHHQQQQQLQNRYEIEMSNRRKWKAVHDFKGERMGDLSVKKGDILTVVKKIKNNTKNKEEEANDDSADDDGSLLASQPGWLLVAKGVLPVPNNKEEEEKKKKKKKKKGQVDTAAAAAAEARTNHDLDKKKEANIAASATTTAGTTITSLSPSMVGFFPQCLMITNDDNDNHDHGDNNDDDDDGEESNDQFLPQGGGGGEGGGGSSNNRNDDDHGDDNRNNGGSFGKKTHHKKLTGYDWQQIGTIKEEYSHDDCKEKEDSDVSSRDGQNGDLRCMESNEKKEKKKNGKNNGDEQKSSVQHQTKKKAKTPPAPSEAPPPPPPPRRTNQQQHCLLSGKKSQTPKERSTVMTIQAPPSSSSNQDHHSSSSTSSEEQRKTNQQSQKEISSSSSPSSSSCVKFSPSSSKSSLSKTASSFYSYVINQRRGSTNNTIYEEKGEEDTDEKNNKEKGYGSSSISDDKGQLLWNKLVAIEPSEYRGKEADFQGIFGRWLTEVY